MATREFLRYINECQVVVGRIVVDDPGATSEWVRGVLAIPQLRTKAEEIVARHIVEDICQRVDRMGRASDQSLSDGQSALARAAIDVIAVQFRNSSLRVEQVAYSLRVSRWHLGRVLARDTGHHFRWHLASARVREASRLIGVSALTMKEIAAGSGFSSAAELTRHFVALRGITPTRCRQLMAFHVSPHVQSGFGQPSAHTERDAPRRS